MKTGLTESDIKKALDEVDRIFETSSIIKMWVQYMKRDMEKNTEKITRNIVNAVKSEYRKRFELNLMVIDAIRREKVVGGRKG